MELKIKKMIKKSRGGAIFFFIISLLTLAFIVLYTLDNLKSINTNFIVWIVIMVFIFLVLLLTAISKLKQKEQITIIDDVISYEPLYTEEELKEKSRGLKGTQQFKDIKNNFNIDDSQIINKIEDNNLGANNGNN